MRTVGRGLDSKQSGAQKEDDVGQKITDRDLTHTDPDGSRCDSHRLSAGHNELLNHSFAQMPDYSRSSVSLAVLCLRSLRLPPLPLPLKHDTGFECDRLMIGCSALSPASLGVLDLSISSC
ncbi:unnamed protein product [Leuciscus chuanchicus]